MTTRRFRLPSPCWITSSQSIVQITTPEARLADAQRSKNLPADHSGFRCRSSRCRPGFTRSRQFGFAWRRGLLLLRSGRRGRAEKNPSSHWRRPRPIGYGQVRIVRPFVAAAAPWVNSGGVISDRIIRRLPSSTSRATKNPPRPVGPWGAGRFAGLGESPRPRCRKVSGKVNQRSAPLFRGRIRTGRKGAEVRPGSRMRQVTGQAK
jgi:hypothetical protein